MLPGRSITNRHDNFLCVLSPHTKAAPLNPRKLQLPNRSMLKMLRCRVVLRQAASLPSRLQPVKLHARPLPIQLRTTSTAPKATETAAAAADSAVSQPSAADASGGSASTAAATPPTADSGHAAANGVGSSPAEPELRGFQRDTVIRSGSTASGSGAQSGRGARLYFQLAMCVAIPAAGWWAWHRYLAVKGERLLSKTEEELRKLIADVEKLGPGRASVCIARSDLALLLLEGGRVEEAETEIARALADIHASRGDEHYLVRRCKVIREMVASRAQRSGAALPLHAGGAALLPAESAAPVAPSVPAVTAADAAALPAAVPPVPTAAVAAAPEYTGWRALFVKAFTPIFGPPRPPTPTPTTSA